MRVVIAMPGKLAEVAEIENDLKSLQQAVGGYIETLPSWFEDVVLICNEEGKLKRMEPNRAIGGDIIVGPIVVARANDTTGEFEDLPEFAVDFIRIALDNMML